MMGYLRMMRIGDWIRFYMAAPLVGAVLAGGSGREVAFVGVAYFLLIAYAFAVNNYYDVDIDRLHAGKVQSGKNPLASGDVSRHGTTAMLVLLAVPAIPAAMAGPAAFVLVASNILLFTAYSERRLRLKERIVLDTATHGLMFGAVPFLAGFALAGGSMTAQVVYLSALPFILASEALIAHQVVEYPMDIGVTRTTVTVIGPGRGLLVLGLMALASIALLVQMARSEMIPAWIAAATGWYLLAYPAYSCRGVFGDIRRRASIE